MWYKLDPREYQTNLHLTKTNNAMSLVKVAADGSKLEKEGAKF